MCEENTPIKVGLSIKRLGSLNLSLRSGRLPIIRGKCFVHQSDDDENDFVRCERLILRCDMYWMKLGGIVQDNKTKKHYREASKDEQLR
jgi:hypothetical protein